VTVGSQGGGAGAAGAGPSGEGGAPRALRVLVVDDEDEILELLTEYLRARGHLPVAACDGQEAIELLRAEPFDLLLTDLRMPQVGGVALIEAAAALPRPVGVVAMTGFPAVELVIDAFKAGATDLLRKPFRLRDVHDALLQAVARVERARAEVHARDRLHLLELAWSLSGRDLLPRFCGLLATVARQDTGAAEVALWLLDPRGWSAVARGGEVRVLADLDPSIGEGPPGAPGELSVASVAVDGVHRGTLAVAGGRPRTEADHARVRFLAEVAAQVLRRVDPGARRLS